MNFLKRAITSVKRGIGKSIILLILIVVLGSVISGAISMSRAIGNTEANLRRNIPTIITLEYIPFRIQNSWDLAGRDEFMNETLQQVGSLPYVDFFEYSLFHFIHSLHFRRYESEEMIASNAMQGAATPLPGEGFDFHSLRGFSRPDIVYIEAGELEIVAGRTFTTEEIDNSNKERTSVAVISRQMAQHNNVWVGDTFELNSLIDFETEETISYYFEIIGIRDFIERPELADSEMVQDSIMNNIFVPNWIVNEVERESREYNEFLQNQPVFTVSPHFVLHDHTQINDFLTAAYEILPEDVWLNDYSSRFGALTHATDMIVDLVNATVWAAVAAAIIVLTLMVTLFLHDRRHEIGIYLSLGEKKSAILLQLLTEVFIVSTVGIVIALFVGNLVSTQISESMILDEIIAFEEGRDWWELGPTTIELSFASEALTHEDMIAAFDTSLGFDLIAIVSVVSLFVVAISTIVPILYVAKLNPKKVLL